VSEPLMLTVRQAAAELPCGRDTMYRLVNSGEIPSVAIGRKRLIPRVALARWIEDKIAESTGGAA
jgi:excisionase family DNA binding protein